MLRIRQVRWSKKTDRLNNPVNAVYSNGLNTPTVNSTISAL